MEKLFERLNVIIESDFLEEAYKKAINLNEIPHWLTKEYILKLNEELDVFGVYLEKILLALSKVKEDADLLVFVKILYFLIELSPKREDVVKNIKLPLKTGEEDEVIGYNMAAVFPVAAHILKLHDSFVKRGIEEEYISATLKFLELGIKESSERMNCLSYNEAYFTWDIYYLYEELIRIERFEMQVVPHFYYHVQVLENQSGERVVLADNLMLHREGHVLGTAGYMDEDGSYKADVTQTEEYFEGYKVDNETHLFENKKTKFSKKEWKVILKDGDAVFGIHIPANLPLDDETCMFSFKKAKEVLPRCFPEYDFKAFVTGTWLLAPELKEFLKPQSNILAFQKYFTIFPSEYAYGKAVFSFVYQLNVFKDIALDYNTLKEDTSLMRNIKKHYLDGKYVHEFNGFFTL